MVRNAHQFAQCTVHVEMFSIELAVRSAVVDRRSFVVDVIRICTHAIVRITANLKSSIESGDFRNVEFFSIKKKTKQK